MLNKRIILFLKGMAMGAADVVPGVSGGTIAFITGIYNELLSSIAAINFTNFRLLIKSGPLPFWKAVNGSFLLILFTGIFTSIFSISKLVSFLLQYHQIELWSFFFGLVLSSIIYMFKKVDTWNWVNFLALTIGGAVAYYITILPPFVSGDSSLFLFISGAIAVCAMILPGISGSFILLILGAYKVIMEAVSQKNVAILATVAAGCGVGLLLFSKLLKWMFDKFEALTISVLTGFLVGSLNKIWPWKHIVAIFVKHEGTPKEEVVSLLEKSVLPIDYDIPVVEMGQIIGYEQAEPHLLAASLFFIVGFGLILGMEKMSKAFKK